MKELNNEMVTEVMSQGEEAYKSGSVQYMDSREVAEIVEKKHKNLLRDITRYCKELNQLNFEPIEFFVESIYRDSQGRNYKCYLVTKKGCEFIAHKLTGIKGTKFTATYINRFHEMEDIIQSGVTSQIEALNKRINDILELMHKQQELMLKLIENQNIVAPESTGVKNSANPFGSSNTELEERKKELYRLTAKVSELCNINQTKVLHYMYQSMEEELGVTLNAYKSVYMSETGKNDVSMVEVVASDNRLYETATKMNREVIERKQLYG